MLRQPGREGGSWGGAVGAKIPQRSVASMGRSDRSVVGQLIDGLMLHHKLLRRSCVEVK